MVAGGFPGGSSGDTSAIGACVTDALVRFPGWRALGVGTDTVRETGSGGRSGGEVALSVWVRVGRSGLGSREE